jgi:hypothetical protein
MMSMKRIFWTCPYFCQRRGEMIWDITATVDQLGMTWSSLERPYKARYTCDLVLCM